MISTTNPATGKSIKKFSSLSWEDIQTKLSLAQDTFSTWHTTSFQIRSQHFLKLSSLLQERVTELAALITLEMGKPITESRAELLKSAWVCEYYAKEAEQLLSIASVSTEATASYIRFDPMGVILAVMPWNFPFWQVFRFAAPTLMAGNTAVLKHASNVPQCAQAIEQLFIDAGFPSGAFQTLLISSSQVEAVLRDERVRGVALTGSEPAGISVARIAAEEIKPVVLELGGSDAFIVLADANLDLAVEQATRSRLIATGQSCIAAKRFIVHQSLFDGFVHGLKKSFESLVIGDPSKEDTQIGPLSSENIRADLHEQVIKSQELGAKIVTGGEIPHGLGFFYPPTIITNVTQAMPVYNEETFGPVAMVIAFDSQEDAIRINNDTRFGLGASIWTQDPVAAQQLASQLEVGNIFINSIVKSDPRIPFGGHKKSGLGRELGEYGIKSFTNVKTVWVQ